MEVIHNNRNGVRTSMIRFGQSHVVWLTKKPHQPSFYIEGCMLPNIDLPSEFSGFKFIRSFQASGFGTEYSFHLISSKVPYTKLYRLALSYLHMAYGKF